jgi:hypothetical protein
MLLLYDKVITLIIGVIAAIMLREFIIARNGKLRIIMVWFFSVEIFIYGVFFWYLIHKGTSMIFDTLKMFAFVFTPKMIIKIGLYFYLIKIKKQGYGYTTRKTESGI